MGLKNEKNEPIHPECYFHTLPIEVMFIIFNFMSKEKGFSVSLPQSSPPKKQKEKCSL